MYKGGQENADGFVSGETYSGIVLYSTGGDLLATSKFGEASEDVDIYRINPFYMIINYAGNAPVGGVTPKFAFEFSA